MRPSDSQSDGKIEGGGEFINDAQSAMIFDYELFSFENFFEFFSGLFVLILFLLKVIQ